MNHEERLNQALNALCEYWRETERDLSALRDLNDAGQQRIELLAADLAALGPQLSALQRDMPATAALRQEWQAALAALDQQRVQQIDALRTESLALRQELLTNLQEASQSYSQRLDPLAAELETLRGAGQGVQQNAAALAALGEASAAYNQRLTQLAAELETLRGKDHNFEQHTADLEALRQEMQGLRRNNSELERSLRLQLASAREQLDAQKSALATFSERAQSQSQEVNEHIQTLTGLHQQEQSQRETTLATLSKLNEQTERLEQQISASQAHAADTLRVDQNRLAALEKWLTTQAEQFGRFDPVLRELHGELIATHQRLTALESVETSELVNQQQQRLQTAEQALQTQGQALSEMQQTLEQLAAQAPASAKLHKTLIGALAAAGAIILGLLVLLAAG